MKAAAFNTGSDYHLLDHIAPLAYFLKIPLYTTEVLNTDLAARFYPQVTIRYLPDLEFHFKEIAEEFEALIECKYWNPTLKILFENLYHKKIHLIFCPHGYSEKGFQASLLKPYAYQDGAFLYGTGHFEMLKVLNSLPLNHSFVGNYRLQFYLKYRPFYDSLTTHEFPIDRSRKTLLYAPTWDDADHSSSFFKYGERVISELPDDWNLLLKIHPLLELRSPSKFYRLESLTAKKNIQLISTFPPVYPLLALADAYLGDSSSVGYDFLYFKRPLYFFPTSSPAKIHEAGKVINPSQNIYTQLDLKPTHLEKQEELYNFAFGNYSLIGGKMTTVSRSFKRLAMGLTKVS